MKKITQWLPMPVTREGMMTVREWRAYRLRRRRHIAARLPKLPSYDRWWRRPPLDLANDVFSQLVAAGFPASKITPPVAKRVAGNERAELHQTLAAATALVLEVFLTAGRDEMPVSVNRIFDALAFGWSDHFRAVAEPGIAVRVRSMTPATIRGTRRDLLRWGIDALTFWQTFTEWLGPYYIAERTIRGNRSLCTITLHEAGIRLLALYQTALGRDETRPRWSMLLADERAPVIPDRHHETVAEHPYDVVESGPLAKQVMAILSRARLSFDVTAFRADIEPLEKDDPLRLQFAGTLAELNQRGIRDGQLVTRSRFKRQLNRRFDAVDVSPHYARGREEENWVEVIPEKPTVHLGGGRHRAGHSALGVTSSVRGRWFAFCGPFEHPETGFADLSESLKGVDVSSSQTSILALLLGLSDLERITEAGEFNDTLVKLAWTHRRQLLKPGYRAGDQRLRELVKAEWMRTSYGSPPAWAAIEMSDHPEKFGPGWRTPGAAVEFVKMVPNGPDAMAFLRICRRVAARVGAYEGFTFRDPLDPEITVRWNPIAKYVTTVNSNGLKLIVDIPGHQRTVENARFDWEPVGTKTSSRASPHLHPMIGGEYPIDRDALETRLAPCLIHALDAALAGHVVLALDKAGARDIVSINDAWFCQLDSDTIRAAVDEATAVWFATAFGPIYEALLAHLPDGGDRQTVLEASARWRQRVKAGDTPRLALKPDLAVSSLKEKM